MLEEGEKAKLNSGGKRKDFSLANLDLLTPAVVLLGENDGGQGWSHVSWVPMLNWTRPVIFKKHLWPENKDLMYIVKYLSQWFYIEYVQNVKPYWKIGYSSYLLLYNTFIEHSLFQMNVVKTNSYHDHGKHSTPGYCKCLYIGRPKMEDQFLLTLLKNSSTILCLDIVKQIIIKKRKQAWQTMNKNLKCVSLLDYVYMLYSEY